MLSTTVSCLALSHPHARAWLKRRGCVAFVCRTVSFHFYTSSACVRRAFFALYLIKLGVVVGKDTARESADYFGRDRARCVLPKGEVLDQCTASELSSSKRITQ